MGQLFDKLDASTSTQIVWYILVIAMVCVCSTIMINDEIEKWKDK